MIPIPPIGLASIDMLFTNLGIPIDIYVIIVIAIGTIILSAKSVKIGLVITLLLYSLTYTALRLSGLDTTYALYAIFGSLILMALSLYTTKGEQII
jgi:hypothetical protein